MSFWYKKQISTPQNTLNQITDSINYYLSRSKKIANRYKDDTMLLFIRLWEVRLLILNKKKQETLPLIKQFISDSRRIDKECI